LQVGSPSFFTEKGADVSVRDTKNNSAVHFRAVTYSVDIIKLYRVIMFLMLTNIHNENPQNMSVEFGILEERIHFFSKEELL